MSEVASPPAITTASKAQRTIILIPALVLLALFIVNFMRQGVSTDPPRPLEDSKSLSVTPPTPLTSTVSPPASVIVLPPKPRLPGRYAAFLPTRAADQDKSILVFTYDRIRVKVVSCVLEIPQIDYARRIIPGSLRVNDQRDTGPLHLPAYQNNRDGKSLLNFSPVLGQEPNRKNPQTYVLFGDFSIEIGSLINEDHLVAALISKHGELKIASIDVASGAPRGPPKPSDFDRAEKLVYIVGAVAKVDGPQLRNKSVHASLLIDLRPSKTEIDQYIRHSARWESQIQASLTGYSVSNKDLWSPEAERGSIVTPENGSWPQSPIVPSRYKRTFDPPIPHPAYEHPVIP